MPVAFVTIRPIVVFIHGTEGQLEEVFVLADLRWQLFFRLLTGPKLLLIILKNRINKLPLLKVRAPLSLLFPSQCLNKVTFLVCEIKGFFNHALCTLKRARSQIVQILICR